jgi:hypothetical protein
MPCPKQLYEGFKVRIGAEYDEWPMCEQEGLDMALAMSFTEDSDRNAAEQNAFKEDTVTEAIGAEEIGARENIQCEAEGRVMSKSRKTLTTKKCLI